MNQPAINSPKQAYSVRDLNSWCQTPGQCGQKLPCEGRMLWVKGIIDPLNIFDFSAYPQLEYEKFRIMDSSGEFLEVFVESDKSRQIFSAVHRQVQKNHAETLVLGTIKGVDHQVMNQCKRSIYLTLNNQGKILFPG